MVLNRRFGTAYMSHIQGTGGPEKSVTLYQLGLFNDQDGRKPRLHGVGNLRSGRILFEEK